jgi:hypothetical protein
VAQVPAADAVGSARQSRPHRFLGHTCINWLRTFPYVRAWAEKCKDKGLVVIGVHSPEFSFEKNITNIRWAVKALRLDYPVAVDSEHLIWRAFNNQYWPALYFIDAQGRVLSLSIR